MYEQIEYEVTDPVAVITLNRPEALNAWTTQMGAEVRHAIGRAEKDPAAVGIVLTGAGRGFCAGADLNMLAGIGEGEGMGDASTDLQADPGDPSWGEDLRGEYTYLLSVPKPIIAAINGPVAAWACRSRCAATCATWQRTPCSRHRSRSAGSSANGASAGSSPASSARLPRSTSCSPPARST